MDSSLNRTFRSAILEATGASGLAIREVIQELWSGYGQILRIDLEGSDLPTVVVKLVRLPRAATHPRGWNSEFSHQRKVFSYQVESEWYRSKSNRCDDRCRIPRFLTFARNEDEVLFVLEDLDSSGYPLRLTSPDLPEIELCLEWLAEFHATFLGETPTGLWEIGTYWHLETRPEELEALEDAALREAAPDLDRRLNAARFQTFVHGDAKLANFCFSEERKKVAALDFQYVGGGCGMKDVAYFLGSCLDEDDCERLEGSLLDVYFGFLSSALERRRPAFDPTLVEAEWRELFPVAWTDFHRFLKGWCPGHWKIHSYSERLSREVIASLSHESLDH